MHISMSGSMMSPGFSEEDGKFRPLRLKRKKEREKANGKRAPSHPPSGCFWFLIVISAEFHAEENSWTTGMEFH